MPSADPTEVGDEVVELGEQRTEPDPRRLRYGDRPASAPTAAASASRAPPSSVNAAWAAAPAVAVPDGVCQLVLEGLEPALLVRIVESGGDQSRRPGIAGGRSPAARARRSPPRAASSASSSVSRARAARSGARSTPPKSSSAARCVAGAEQALVGVLAVQVDDRSRHLGQGGHRRRPTVDVGPRPPLGRHDAASAPARPPRRRPARRTARRRAPRARPAGRSRRRPGHRRAARAPRRASSCRPRSRP